MRARDARVWSARVRVVKGEACTGGRQLEARSRRVTRAKSIAAGVCAGEKNRAEGKAVGGPGRSATVATRCD